MNQAITPKKTRLEGETKALPGEFDISGYQEEKQSPIYAYRESTLGDASRLQGIWFPKVETSPESLPHITENPASIEEAKPVVKRRGQISYWIGAYLSSLLVTICLMSIVAGRVVGRTLFDPTFSLFWLLGGSMLLITNIVGFISKKQ